MIIINCFRHAGFKAPNAEAALSSGSPQHEHKEAVPSSCEQLRQMNQVVTDLSFEEFLCANADEDATMASDDEGNAQLITGAPEGPTNAGNAEEGR